MNKVKINLNDYKEGIIVLVTIFQLIIMLYYINVKKDTNIKEKINYITPTKATFNEVFNSLNNIENLKVLEIEDLDTEWYTKVLITGDKEKIVEVTNKLENFEMYSYDISGTEGVLSVILEFYR